MDENGPPQNVSVSQWSELGKEGHLKMTTLTKTLTGENGEANLSLLYHRKLLHY